MIPSPWIAFVLALATFRVARLIGWDDFPPVARARWWVTGTYIVRRGTGNSGLTNEPDQQRIEHRRPVVADLLACPYCLGFWVSLLALLGWWIFPTETLYAAAPFALSAAVGIIARWLDP